MAKSKSRKVYKRLFDNRLAIVGLLIVAVLLVVGIFAPFLSPYDPNHMYFAYAYSPPSTKFLLGTDALGRDLLSRIIYGARTSLIVGSFATLIGLIIGVSFGAIAGYWGGGISQVFMRLADIQLTIPMLILLIVIASVIGQRSLAIITIIIGVGMWPRIGRVTRSKIMELKGQDFIEAARALGVNPFRILWKHLLPNALGPIIVLATLDIGGAILTQASLSFLGLGDPRTISWGGILSNGLVDMIYDPWIAVFPGLAIFLTVWGLNTFGDGIRDALDVEG